MVGVLRFSYVEGSELLPILVEGIVVKLGKLLLNLLSCFGLHTLGRAYATELELAYERYH